ncbi:MAG: response regulator [Pirellulaceae bacterium]|nr:response regulator [Planctomycetales bacterium]
MTTVLVVDDSAVDRRLAGGVLESDPSIGIEYASSGEEALERIGKFVPSLVLTDLQMPNMNGLELVRTITLQYPDLPVVLMTAHGSEVIAAQALAGGATSYVPKAQLADLLMATVQPILAMAASETTHKRLIECSTRTQFSFRLHNDLSLIDPLTQLVQNVIGSMGLWEYVDRVRVGVALEQAVLNAIFRGNLELTAEQWVGRSERGKDGTSDIVSQRLFQEPYRDRSVYVDVDISRAGVRFIVRDDGKGFDTSIIPQAGDPESLRDGLGRGLVLITTFMDEVSFNDSGNEVTLIKQAASN